METSLDPWIEHSLLQIRLNIARCIETLRGARDDFAQRTLKGWIFQIMLLDQFRTALIALQTSSMNGPGVFLASIIAHIDGLVDINADGPDVGTDSAIVNPREGLGDEVLTIPLRDVDLSAEYGETYRVDSQPRSGDATKLAGHEIVVRSLFDTLQQASKLSDRRIWLCPLHADVAHCSTQALRDHLLDGAHGVSEEQAKILVMHAVTRPMNETDDAWEPNCDARLIDAHGQVMDELAAIVADFCIAADTVQQEILLRSDHRSEGNDERLVKLRRLHDLLSEASLQCRQHCQDGLEQLGVEFGRGDAIASQDLYNIHRGLSRQFEDIVLFNPSGGLNLTHHRYMCSVTQRGHHEVVQAIIELVARLSKASGPDEPLLTVMDVMSLHDRWLYRGEQHEPSDGPKPRPGGKTNSVTSSASTVFSKRSIGISSASSVAPDDATNQVFMKNDQYGHVTIIPGYRSKGNGTNFFEPGRVFEMAQTVIAAWSARSSSAQATSTDSYGQPLIAKRRAFISVYTDATSCRAVPITSYGGEGVSKFGVVKVHHCIVHTTDLPPERLDVEAPDALRQEEPMQPIAIHIDADPAAGWALPKTSRLNLGDEQRVAHITRVKNLGRVNWTSMPHLESQLKRVRELRSPHPTLGYNFDEALEVLSRSGVSPEIIQEYIESRRAQYSS